MTDKEAFNILLQMLEERSLTDEEKAALKKAIGVLSWSTLAESRIKNLAKKKAERDRE